MEQQECPSCGATMPVYQGYTTWCDRCNWNIQLHEPAQPRNVLESFYASLGQRLGQSLLDEMKGARELRRTLTPATIAASALAAGVHIVTVAFVVLGLFALIAGQLHILAISACAICLGIAWAMRPRMGAAPTHVVPREKTPALYDMVDAVARALDAPRVDGIVVGAGFTAGFSQAGWPRKSFLHLGLPLWSILDADEKVALLAHELAHGVNGDPTRSLFVGSAIDTLVRWHTVLRPRSFWARGVGNFYHLVLVIALSAVAVLACLLARAGIYLLSHLLWRDAQRAEYLADYLAARTAGTAAMRSTLDKLHYVDLFARTCRQAFERWGEADICDEFARRIARMPSRELERLRRVEQLRPTRLDATHPPTAYRLAFLAAREVAPPALALAPADVARADRELDPYRKAIQRQIVNLRKSA